MDNRDLQIVQMPITALRPYKNNARKHEQVDVEAIIASIREFGFLDPIGIWSDENIIVEGHGRYISAKKLGMKIVPCIRLDFLTDEERRAYCLAHNKTAELSSWEQQLLGAELKDIINIDMSTMGFTQIELSEPDIPIFDETEPQQDSDEEEEEEQNERTFNKYHLFDVDLSRHTKGYEMPILKACYHIPKDIISFNYMLTSEEYDKGIHFYIDDYQFERLWNDTEKYIEKLKKFDCVLTPDFSLYTEMPLPMQIWSIYRSKLIGQILQDKGMKVIPTLQWCRKDSFLYAWDGLPKNSVVSVSTIGVKKEEQASRLWFEGMDDAMNVLSPKAVIVYGGDIGYDFGKAKAIYIGNHNSERFKEATKK